MNVCTIIAKNYVAHARVLARSLAQTHPGSRLWTLIIDDFSSYIDPAEEPFEILTPADVGCDEFGFMALRYSVLELSTAVKPWLLRHLMGVTGEPVTYLDPDIRIYGSLAPLAERAERHGVVLIPHNSRPIPQDGRRPSQVDVMIAGIYNLGYVTVAARPEVDRLLDWWADRLRRDCRVDPIWGYFVDQRWFDLAPGFLSDLAIVRDPEFNLAYWNLHERRLEHEAGTYLVDGRPLSFFHFSGFDPEHPLILSRHQDRVDVLSQPVLERLLAEYAAEVISDGHAVSRRWPYEFSVLGDGTRLDDKLRALFDEFAESHDGAVESPFTLEGVRAFDSWLAEQAPEAPPGISRALARVYEDRADVRGAYPNVTGGDRARLLAWAHELGVAEEPALARALRTGAQVPMQAGHAAEQRSSSTAETILRGAPWGVNVLADFHSQHDHDHDSVARALIEGLDAAGVRSLPVHLPSAEPGRDDDRYVTATPDQAPFTVNVISADPGQLPELVQQLGAAFFAGRYSVGLWPWATEAFPDGWRERFSLLEEVWAPSAHSAAALQSVATVPVHQIRVPVDPYLPEPRTRAELGLRDAAFMFYARFDLAGDAERQNPVAAIEAFKLAFEPGADACLVLECVNAVDAPDELELLRGAAAQRPDIDLIDVQRSLAESRSALALCDCYVSLHRAVAFGLAMAQAMGLGKPVIATGYSGNLDYMTAENSRLVGHRPVKIGTGHSPYPADGEWAQPDLEHAARLMREVFDDRDGASELGARAAESIRTTHSPEVAGQLLARRLESIRATGRARFSVDPVDGIPQALARLPMRVRQGPESADVGGGRARAAREQLRTAVLRVIRPYSAYQQAVNSDVVAALGELSQSIDQARDEFGAERADALVADRRGQSSGPAASRVGGVEEIKRILTQQTDRGVYLALSELRDRHRDVGSEPSVPPADRSLTSSELRVFSQNGEDGVLAEILRRTGARSRFFVEFGVESGREGNCVYLADVAGWAGLFIEAGADMYRQLERKYLAQSAVETIQARVGAENVEALFAQAGVPPEPDVVSIDVDGQDYWIWDALQAYRPRVVVVEYNSALDPRRQLVQPDEPGHAWSGTEYYGASLGALVTLGERKGYRLVHSELSGVNAFFVRSDLAGDSFPAADRVAMRGSPNYFQRGQRHPPPPLGARYLDLESGRLVSDVNVPHSG